MREEFAFLHIGKTGGSAIRDAIYKDQGETATSPIKIFGHRIRLADILAEQPSRRVFFIVRDPVSRFVSGFNSRMRKGKWGTNDWNPGEQKIFSAFATPNEMAEALGGDDPGRRETAVKGMRSSVHFKFGLQHCLESVEYLESVADRIAFIAHLPTLTDDFSLLKRIIGLPDVAGLPAEDQTMFHKAPPTQERYLSAVGEQNIREHYRNEFPIYQWCLAYRDRLISKEQIKS